jgi:hypothetical protein
MTDFELACATATMLGRLQIGLKAELAGTTDAAERQRLEVLLRGIPDACLLLGVAAARLQDDAGQRQPVENLRRGHEDSRPPYHVALHPLHPDADV